MKAIASAIVKIIQRLFTTKSPKPQMTPKKIQSNKLNQRAETANTRSKQSGPTQQGNVDQGNSSFFQDRLEAEGSDSMRNFYSKYRSRLQKQDPDLSRHYDPGIDR